MSQAEALVGLRQPGHYITQLESLRGWAILLVVAFHYFGILLGGMSGLADEAPFWLRLLAAGNTGVTLFFVLSGFLLMQPFIRALRSGEQISIRGFYVSRLLRILPLYYLAVFVAWLVSSNSPSALKALLFLPVGFEIFPFSVPWWSLCTEMQFYLLLPWIMLALNSAPGRYLMLVGGIAYLVLHGVYLLRPQWLGGHAPVWLQSTLFGRGTAFLIGGLCAWFYLGRGRQWLLDSRYLIALVFLLLLGLMTGLLQWYGVKGQKPALILMPLYHDLEALLWGGLLLCSLGLKGGLQKLIINPLISHFGTISYSLYLVHVPIQFYLIYPVKVAIGDTGTLSDIRMLTAVGGSFLLSWLAAVLCYRFIESPFLKLKPHLPVLTGRLLAHPAKA
ncbi:acyltransferase family protein [Pseudomonas sp.]|uniref:acyltransferase family protein n=1 Tax=Pseudomonas sp. TaxID=306 RepID=UPI003BB54D1E